MKQRITRNRLNLVEKCKKMGVADVRSLPDWRFRCLSGCSIINRFYSALPLPKRMRTPMRKLKGRLR